MVRKIISQRFVHVYALRCVCWKTKSSTREHMARVVMMNVVHQMNMYFVANMHVSLRITVAVEIILMSNFVLPHVTRNLDGPTILYNYLPVEFNINIKRSVKLYRIYLYISGQLFIFVNVICDLIKHVTHWYHLPDATSAGRVESH